MQADHPLLTKLERVIDLDKVERSALSTLPFQEVEVRADQEILREGDQPVRCFLILDGVTCTSQAVEGGLRQIDSFHIAGDMPDLHSLHLDAMDCDMWAVTNCRLAFMDHSAIRQLCEAQPRVAAALWRLTVVDAAIYRQWVTNLGQRPALNRLAHLFCEMMLRMEAIGRTRDGSCALPITQADLSDATGLSVVHVNRTLKDLREMRLVTHTKGQLTIHDWEALMLLADFRPGYLHLPGLAPGARGADLGHPRGAADEWPSSSAALWQRVPSERVEDASQQGPRSGSPRARDAEEQP
jgi:CRP-like cAMP-binding protein